MKKTLLFAVALALMSCNASNREIAERFLLDNATFPDALKVLSCNETFRPDSVTRDTLCHVVATDGRPGHRPMEWWNVSKVFIDSVKVQEHNYPAHYYCRLAVEGINDEGQRESGLVEVAVFPDGTAVFYDQYQERCMYSYIETAWMQHDTLTNVRDHIDLNRYSGGWELKSRLFQLR